MNILWCILKSRSKKKMKETYKKPDIDAESVFESPLQFLFLSDFFTSMQV